jgi:isoleucyl-tRNA synthetase
MKMPFDDVPNTVDFVAQEHQVLKFWADTDAFNKLRALRKGGPRFGFTDGPITANNPMGVHHAWGRTYKDLFLRYKAMQGFDQRWQNGFDCQGLWVEVNVEKELGFKSKRDIESYGLAEFVKLCKQRVLKYAAVQTDQSIRLGYWMDWNDLDVLQLLHDKLGEDPNRSLTVEGPLGPVTGTVEQLVGQLGLPQLGGSYFTFSDENNYLIWSMLKKCNENGWLYKGRDVMPWCARCGTGISQHEIVTDGYQELTHRSVFMHFPLTARPGETLLVWTTTPWTLTSNVAAAVHPELPYLLVEQGEYKFWLAKGAMENAVRGEFAVVDEKLGEEMLGWRYRGPFDELPAVFKRQIPEAHRVIAWKEVGEAEGTGIVHIAPGCGAEDYQLAGESDPPLPILAPLDDAGIYVEGFDWLTGRSAHDVAEDIFQNLGEKNLVYRIEAYTHRYPTCWRCHEELIFRLVDEWFISMGELYDKQREQVTTEEKARSLRYQIMDVVDQIRWVPSFGYDREMDWLRNMHDWMISKKRYWGLALPIWECHECGHFTVIGDEHELEERAVEGWDEFKGHTPHRPYVDAVKIACQNCGALVSRIKDVGNPWLDAGIVSMSTMGYRQDPEYWEKWYPADWISESFPGQFRNWFYSLLAMGTVMTGRPPFLNVFSYATLLAEDGRPMHKSWGNSIEFNEAADQMGVDVMRWMYVNHKPDSDLLFGYHVADETRRRFLIPLWNVYSFFVTYANLDGWAPNANGKEAKLSRLDHWLMARLDQTVLQVTQRLEEYDAWHAAEAIEKFVDELSNWYLRLSRRRFWKSEADADKEAAYQTLYQTLVKLVKLLAPFVPFVTETMYQNLVHVVPSDGAEAPESVHHCAWPAVDLAQVDMELLEEMDLAMLVAALGRSARANGQVTKLRQPLSLARVHVGTEREKVDLSGLADLLKDEINVKELEVVKEVGELVQYRLLPLNKVLGPKHGRLFPQVRKALMALDPAPAVAKLHAGENLLLEVDGQQVELSPEEVIIQTHAAGGYAIASDRGVTVAVDTTMNAELAQEGLARDLVRLVQVLRKKADLQLDDRIRVTFEIDDEQVAAAVAAHADYIKAETLCDELAAGPPPDGAAVLGQDDPEVKLPVNLSIQKV